MLGIVWRMGHVSDVALHVNCWLLSMPIVMLASTSVTPVVICVPLSLFFSKPLCFRIRRDPCGSLSQHAKLQPRPSLVSITSLQLTVLNIAIFSLFFYNTKGALHASVLSKLHRENISHRTTTLISVKRLPTATALSCQFYTTVSCALDSEPIMECVFRLSLTTFSIVYIIYTLNNLLDEHILQKAIFSQRKTWDSVAQDLNQFPSHS